MKPYKKIFEKFIKRFTIVNAIGKVDETELYVNPQTLSKFQRGVRGIVDSKGNLFIWDNLRIIHLDILKYLINEKIINIPLSKSKSSSAGYLNWLLKYNIVPVQENPRGERGVFYLSESLTNDVYIENNYNIIDEIFIKAKNKNKNLEFVVEKITRF